ncbi:MAG: FKBP-type peptidyl-prolyl cis-trans isomerase [Steroidobacteraceae bacterium]|nr:FKBP-type peptidyl-prolyl cis-trans isomerase [Steroidobacteraceae bacterium]
MRIYLAPALLSLALTALPASGAEPQLATEEDKTLYALGQLISKNLDAFQLTPKELEIVQSGLKDGVNGKAALDPVQYADQIENLHRTRLAALTAKEKAAGQAFAEKEAKGKGATKTASGIVITTLKPGTGPSPGASDQVKVNYEGKLIDGTVFDSSIKRGEPATFPLDGVIPCWTEALQLMKVGGKSRFVCPSSLAYGDRGSPPQIRSGATLVFDVELLDVVKQPTQAPQPAPAPQQ